MKIYAFLATGFEEVEALGPIDVCRRAGLEVITVSIMDELTVVGAHGVGIVADSMFADNDYSDADMLFLPGKASNAGGVGTSALEMCQNSMRMSWTFEEVDEKLKHMMNDIYAKISDAAKRYGVEGNYVTGANIAGFEKVADAMIAQGTAL